MRYRGMTYESTKQGLWDTLDKIAALEKTSEDFVEATKPTEKKVSEAIKSLTKPEPEEGNKPNDDGVKESGCGSHRKKSLKQASYALDLILSKKKV